MALADYELNIEAEKSELYSMDEIKNKIKNKSKYDSDFEENEINFNIFAQPQFSEDPFISVKRKGVNLVITLIWAKFEDNNPPNSIGSQGSYRENGKPSVVQYTIDENLNYEINEMLFVMENGFNRYIFKNGVVDTMVAMFDYKGKKFYELDAPLFIKFYPSGKKKEEWYFNPKAESFKDARSTRRMIDDKPVVITYHEDGDIYEEDYTGYIFSKKVHKAINAFPFGSRYSFYKPSYIRYEKDTNGLVHNVVEKYFFQQEQKEKDDILNVLEGFGADSDDLDSIPELFEQNPMFEDMVRNMLGVTVLTDEELDKFYKL